MPQHEPASPRSGDQNLSARPAVNVPAVNVIEDQDGITLSADLPVVPKETLRVQVDGDTTNALLPSAGNWIAREFPPSCATACSV